MSDNVFRYTHDLHTGHAAKLNIQLMPTLLIVLPVLSHKFLEHVKIKSSAQSSQRSERSHIYPSLQLQQTKELLKVVEIKSNTDSIKICIYSTWSSSMQIIACFAVIKYLHKSGIKSLWIKSLFWDVNTCSWCQSHKNSGLKKWMNVTWLLWNYSEYFHKPFIFRHRSLTWRGQGAERSMWREVSFVLNSPAQTWNSSAVSSWCIM